VVFALLYGLGRLVAGVSHLVRARLYRVMPKRRADVLGFLLVGLALLVLTRDGLLDATIGTMDASFEAAQDLFDTAPPAPSDPRVPGSAA
jgi:uncharacterized membrane protein